MLRKVTMNVGHGRLVLVTKGDDAAVQHLAVLKIYRENISHLEARHLGHLMRNIAIASLVHLLCWQSLRFRQVSNPHPAPGVVSCRENMPFSPSSLVELFGRLSLPLSLVCALTIILVTYTFLRSSFAFASTSLKSAI